ncbi:hypothetical protein Goarm_017194 [Gossypium armourianum]|uniref:Uncharacterized protein n=1 Tax=Gossypium armourianum TaxID=34283 RepID=A0A7J9JFE7_9ROSI|nr:hypothetical protein [Gossypium armourianum]
MGHLDGNREFPLLCIEVQSCGAKSSILSFSLITIYMYNFEVWLMENRGEYSNTGYSY